MTGDPLIVRRIDAAIGRAGQLGAGIHAIALTETDRALLTRLFSHRWRRQLRSRAIFHPTEYREHPLRTGKRTMIYTNHGVAIVVPRRLPA